MSRGLSLLFMVAALAGVGQPARAAGAPVPATPPNTARPTLGAGSNFSAIAYDEGRREAPALLARMGIACTVRQAVFEGESTLLDAKGQAVGRARLYEVACEEGLGYLLNDRGKATALAFDCIGAGQGGKIACMLPLNRHPAGGLDPYLKATGVPCAALRARLIGQDSDQKLRRYEVACKDGGGYVLDIPLADGSGPAPSATDCFEDESECRFTPHVENVAVLAYKVGKAFGEGCRIGDARYVGHVPAHDDDLYEVSCQKGRDGQLIEVDQTGRLRNATDCARVKLVGAACQLKPVDTVDPLVQRAEATAIGERSAVTVTDPDWLRKPSGRQFSDLYPRLAQVNRINGQTELNCRIAVSGDLQDCIVIDESPAGFGFGAAALKMAPSFRMRPESVDGRPIAGAQVEIPINFEMR